jgi:hypothetical protein
MCICLVVKSIEQRGFEKGCQREYLGLEGGSKKGFEKVALSI